MFIGFIHSAVAKHQGRVVTMAILMKEGYYPLKGKRRVSKIIDSCLTCRKLRGKPMVQKMADLPPSRLKEAEPFQRSGIDVFGPFLIRRGRATRANAGHYKLWVLLFKCLYSKAIHMECLEHMNVDSFKLAFDRFQSRRGRCSYLVSDSGSNFTGARN